MVVLKNDHLPVLPVLPVFSQKRDFYVIDI